MNRIREIRETLGMTSDQLAERVGTSGVQIRRLEAGTRRLTVDWMQRIAAALECSPADLIATAVIAEAQDEVEPADAAIASIAGALAKKGLRLFRVKSDAVSDVGITVGDLITVDEGSEAIAAADNADIVLVRIADPPTLVLRQFMRPNLLLTNRPGANLAIKTSDRSVGLSIVGVVVRN